MQRPILLCRSWTAFNWLLIRCQREKTWNWVTPGVTTLAVTRHDIANIEVEAVDYHEDRHTMFLKQPAEPLAFGIGEFSVLTVTHGTFPSFPLELMCLLTLLFWPALFMEIYCCNACNFSSNQRTSAFRHEERNPGHLVEAHVLQHQICTEQAAFDVDVVAGERMYDFVCCMIDNLRRTRRTRRAN